MKATLIGAAMLAATPALADCEAMRRLDHAVTRYDVNVTIRPENVARWNEVIRATMALRRALGCHVDKGRTLG